MPPIGARSLIGEGGSGSPLGHPPYKCVCSGDMKSPAQTEVLGEGGTAFPERSEPGAIHRTEWGVSCGGSADAARGAHRPSVKTKGPPRGPAAWGRLRRPDSNRRPSGYEPDELPLLHAADG